MDKSVKQNEGDPTGNKLSEKEHPESINEPEEIESKSGSRDTIGSTHSSNNTESSPTSLLSNHHNKDEPSEGDSSSVETSGRPANNADSSVNSSISGRFSKYYFDIDRWIRRYSTFLVFLATLILALGTFLLTCKTNRLAMETKKMADATRQMVTITERQLEYMQKGQPVGVNIQSNMNVDVRTAFQDLLLQGDSTSFVFRIGAWRNMDKNSDFELIVKNTENHRIHARLYIKYVVNFYNNNPNDRPAYSVNRIESLDVNISPNQTESKKFTNIVEKLITELQSNVGLRRFSDSKFLKILIDNLINVHDLNESGNVIGAKYPIKPIIKYRQQPLG